MKKNFIYNKKTGRVSGYSDQKIFTNEEQAEFELDDDQKKKLNDNWEPYVRNGNLEFDKPPKVIEDEKKAAFEQAKQEVADAQNFKELQEAILDLLNII